MVETPTSLEADADRLRLDGLPRSNVDEIGIPPCRGENGNIGFVGVYVGCADATKNLSSRSFLLLDLSLGQRGLFLFLSISKEPVWNISLDVTYESFRYLTSLAYIRPRVDTWKMCKRVMKKNLFPPFANKRVLANLPKFVTLEICKSNVDNFIESNRESGVYSCYLFKSLVDRS